jgi:hypothetical protein
MHRHSGPELSESFYTAAAVPGIRAYRGSGTVRSRYSANLQGQTSTACFWPDVLAEFLEIKAAPALLPAHDMQLPTCPRMSGLPAPCRFNFHAPRPKDGLPRFVG